MAEKVKLTNTKIKNESYANGKAKILYDEVADKLQLRISKTKKVFIVRYRFNGQNIKHRIGDYPHISLADARKEAYEIKIKLLDGVDPRESEKEEEQEVRSTIFGDVIQKYREDYISDLRPKTIDQYEVIISNLSYFNEMDITEIERKDISEYLVKRKKESLHGAISDRKLLSAFFNWCISMGYTETNPVTHAIKYKTPKPRERFYDDDEIRKIYKAIPISPSPIGDIVNFLFLTGKRIGETTQLKYEMVDFKNQILNIPPEIIKNDNADEVYLTDSAMRIIKYRQKNYKGDYIFNSTYKKLDQPIKHVHGQVRTFRNKCEIEDFRLHDIRRTITVLLSQMGVAEHVKDLILNNASSSKYATIRYTYDVHDYREEQKEALIKLEAKLEEIISAKKTDEMEK